jgi:ATP-binding cassette subfamily B protein
MQQPLASGGLALGSADPSLCSSLLAGKSLQEARESLDAKEKNDVKRNAVMSLCFVFVVLQSIYIGVQVVSISQADHLAALLITSVIVSANLEFVLLRTAATLATAEEGELIVGLHQHPLYFRSSVQFCMCQVCGERIGQRTGGYDRLECTVCRNNEGKGGGKGGKGGGFTMCMLCYRNQQAKVNTQDGILRGDKGPKVVAQLTSWQYFLRAMRLTKRFRCLLAVAVISVVATQGARVSLPNYTGEIINALVAGDRVSFQKQLLMFIALSIGSALFGCVQGLGVEVVARRLTMDVRREMFESLIKQDIAFFDGAMVGQLTSRMTNDVTQVLAPVRQLMNTVLANVLLLVGGSFMCLMISWKLTVLASTLIGPVIYLTTLYARWSQKLNLTVQTSIADANAIATEALRNVRTVRSFGAERVEVQEFQGCLAEALRSGMKDAFASAGVNAVNLVLEYSATALVLGYGGLSVLQGGEAELTIGQLITFNLYWTMVNQAIKSLNNMLSSLIRAASSAQRVFEIIDLEPDIQLTGGVADSTEFESCTLEIRDVHFTYQMQPNKKIIRGLNLSILPGQTVAIVGRSGAGKTTLMNLLLRLYDPQSGTILLNGRPLSDYDATAYRRHVGVVSQDTQMFCRSITENLAYGLESEEATEDMVIEAARMANAHDFVQGLDGGYQGMVGEGGLRLSGGQRQRLAIARALLRRPSLLLLDEATSALDAENEGQVQQALDKMMSSMAGRCSVVLIAHRLSTVMNADQIIVMNDGQLAEQGTHQELLENDHIYAQLVKRQLAKQANVLSQDAPQARTGDDARPSEGAVESTAASAPAEVAPADSIDHLFEDATGSGVGKGKQKGKGKGKAKDSVASSSADTVPADSIDHLFDEVAPPASERGHGKGKGKGNGKGKSKSKGKADAKSAGQVGSGKGVDAAGASWLDEA